MYNLIKVRDGLTLYKRKNFPYWQARVKIGNQWVRKSTREKDEEAARDKGLDLYYEYRSKKKNNQPITTAKFAKIADYVINELEYDIKQGTGKSVYDSYIKAIKNYLKPFFGKHNINNISPELVKQFEIWRKNKMNKDPAASTINTHNSAFNKIFDYAIDKKWVNENSRPKLRNKGKKSISRPHFTLDEYNKMVVELRKWSKKGKKGKSQEMRELLRDYVLILANTGIRHGTEAYNLKWKDIDWYNDKYGSFIRITVNGKTGGRSLIARERAENYLKRIQSRFPDLASMSFDELLSKKIDVYVFRLRNGERTKNLRQTFRKFLRDNNLAIGSSSNKERTLYSLRHTYATFALMKNIGIHVLARQMGTSVGMIEKHYSKITPELMASKFAGKRSIK